MQNPGKTKLVDLNELLTCILCKGYFIDATTIIECLHSFCRTCIVTHLQSNKHCPTCEAQVHKTRPLINIRSDQTLQDIVYKIVPGLYKNEMKRRRDFYRQNDKLIQSSIPASSEKRGDVWGCDRLIFTSEDIISVSIEYSPLCEGSPVKPQSNITEHQTSRRYLRCPGGLKVCHLKKLLRAKYSLSSPELKVDVLYRHDVLKDEYTLVDLAYIYSWKRNEPLRLFYKVSDLSSTEAPEDEKPIKAIPTALTPDILSQTPLLSPRIPLAAAPSSRHPSPPPSPQMAEEPDGVRVGNPAAAKQSRHAVKRTFPADVVVKGVLKKTSQFDGTDTPLRAKKHVTFSVNLVQDPSRQGLPKTPSQYPRHRKLFKLEPVHLEDAAMRGVRKKLLPHKSS